MADLGRTCARKWHLRPDSRSRIFLLSPANAGGERARLVLSDRAQFELAVRLRAEGAPIADVFSFVSGLYFRGKAVYSQEFALPPVGLAGAFVITPDRGLVPAEAKVTLAELREMAGVPVDAAEEGYRVPLEREARRVAEAAGPECEFVLLGSIATPKYTSPLLDVFGSRLLFPAEFIGRGDMSRGGLLLRCARAKQELEYVAVMNAIRRGARPPKLPKLVRGEGG
jgi:hypothetical protein